jgi:hypothetical protein
MKEIWERAFVSMTSGLELKEVVSKSAGLATLSAVVAIPYLYYLVFVLSAADPLPWRDNLTHLFFTQFFLLYVILFLSSAAGFSFHKRRGIPGLLALEHPRRTIPTLLILGAGLSLVSYILFDRYFYRISPLSYPKDLRYLISFPLKEAVTEEVILRFCMVTLCVGILKKTGPGIVLASFLGSLLTIKYFQFIGMSPELDRLFIIHFSLSFAVNLVLGYIFVTKGLLCVMILKFFFGMKYAIIAWLNI